MIASGLVPPSLEGTGDPARASCWRAWSRPGHGLEVVSKVNDIPKGSRLAVSTNLLASLISAADAGDRADPQPDRPARSGERPRVVVARAILGEWLGGSGGGWQDSGGHLPRRQADPGRAGRREATPNGASAGAGSSRAPLLDSRAATPSAGSQDSPRLWRRASSWSTAAWPRTSGRSSTW